MGSQPSPDGAEAVFEEGRDQFWKTVIDTMMDGLLVVNLEGVILSANQAMEPILVRDVVIEGKAVAVLRRLT